MSLSPMSDEPEIDFPRTLIIEKARKLGISMKDISRKIGKNEAYMHQYLYGRNGRKSPKILPENCREIISNLLEIPEEKLVLPNKNTLSDFPIHSSIIRAMISDNKDISMYDFLLTQGLIKDKVQRVPIYLDTDDIHPEAAREWISSHDRTVPVSYGIWMTQHHGRLRPGDLAYVRLLQLPRPGDAAVALEGRRIRAIGDLERIDNYNVVIDNMLLPTKSLVISKIVSITLA